jgi:hypothetical protein
MAESACCESVLWVAVRACSSSSQWILVTLLLCGLGGFYFMVWSKSKI